MAHGIPFDPYAMAAYLDEKMGGAKVDVLLLTQAVDVRVEQERITHVVIFNKSGLAAVPTKVVIDATGDADIAARSGCRVTKGRKSDGLMMPDDLVQGKEFDDIIGFSSYGWDLPDPKRPSHHDPLPRRKRPYAPMPYRIMVPEPVKNLICPGRAVSVQRDVLGILRVMASCFAMGEAAGQEARQVAENNLAFDQIDVSALRDELRQNAAVVDWQHQRE